MSIHVMVIMSVHNHEGRDSIYVMELQPEANSMDTREL